MSVSPSAEDEWLHEHEPEPEPEVPGVAELILALEHLTVKQRFVIELRYGLKDGVEYTLDEVAEVMGLTHQAVSRIEQRGIAAMQKGVAKGSPR